MSETNKAVVAQNQAWPSRAPAMTVLIQKAFPYPINALEIGVWYGIGSTNIWLDNMKPGSKIVLLDAWKPYSSKQDLRDDEWNYKSMDDRTTDAFMSAFLNVKRHEDENRERQMKISLVRADSQHFLPLLQADSFDFIYIDGDHKYEKVWSDIAEAKRLIRKDFGIICGDDLDKLPTPDLIELSKQFKDRDAIRGDYQFHPGVLLAVSEHFEKVHMHNSFWWIFCINGEFTVDPSGRTRF